MPTYMVGRDIQEHSDVGGKIPGRMQLVRGELGNNPILRVALGDDLDAGDADIAGRPGGFARRLQQRGDELRNGRLAVRAGDAYPFFGRDTPGQLGFADDFAGRLNSAQVQDTLRRDSGARDGHIIMAGHRLIATVHGEGFRQILRIVEALGFIGSTIDGEGVEIAGICQKIVNDSSTRDSQAQQADVAKKRCLIDGACFV